jgi:hypothetical protein
MSLGKRVPSANWTASAANVTLQNSGAARHGALCSAQVAGTDRKAQAHAHPSSVPAADARNSASSAACGSAVAIAAH